MSTTDQPRQVDRETVAFGHVGSSVQDLRDDEFLREIQWRKSADAEIVRAARNGDVAAFCKRLVEALPHGITRAKSAGKRTEPFRGLIAAEYFGTPPSLPLRGLLPKMTVREKNGKSSVKGELSASDEAALSEYLSDVALGEIKPSPADLHVLTELIARNADKLNESTLFALWRTTLTAACELAEDLSSNDDGDPARTADAQLLADGELPWRVGLLFADVKGAAKVRRGGRRIIRRELESRTDGDGTPHATLLPRLGYWLASLIRSGQWADQFEASLWDDDSSVRFNELLEQAIRLYRPTDSWAMSNGFTASPQSLFRAASELAGSDFKVAELAFAWDSRTLRSGRKKSKSKKPASKARAQRRRKPKPSSQSDWAYLACLRSDWAAECDSIVVDHSGPLPHIDMTVLGRELFKGRWDLQIQVDGEPVQIGKDWSAVCWNSDSDGDYLELQQTLAGSGRVERQIWLSRSSRFAMFADSLTGFCGSRVEYTARLPLADSLDAQSDGVDRETRLKTGPALTRVFPLFLPQDRVYSTPGGCGVFGGDLVIKHVASGKGFYAPVVLDWHPHRRRKAVQWRQLTVTEDGRILPGDATAGFRVKLGEHHLLSYRKLQDTTEPHTVLGFQTFDETVLGHFDKDGDVTPLLLVEK